MIKDILLYLSLIPLCLSVLATVIVLGIVVSTVGAGLILGLAYAMIPAPTGV
jgi:hypothetical protein